MKLVAYSDNPYRNTTHNFLFCRFSPVSMPLSDEILLLKITAELQRRTSK